MTEEGVTATRVTVRIDGAEVSVPEGATILDACRRAGVVAGCHANGALTPARLAAGFGMVTVTTLSRMTLLPFLS